MNVSDLKLVPEQLRARTDPALFSFASTAELEPLPRIIGQDRAVRAIDFGIDMPSLGYNIFAVGPAGSGRATAVRMFLDTHARQRPAPNDWCYVYNFQDARRPAALSLPSGRASQLDKLMGDLIQRLRAEIPRAFEGEHYEDRRREIMLEMQAKQQELFQNLESYLNERGFALMRSQSGLNIAPMLNGEILSGDAYQKLDPELRKKFEAFRPDLQEQFDKTMRETRELDRLVRQRVENINNELAGFVVDNLMSEIKEQFADCPKVVEYLTAVRGDVVENVAKFVPGGGEQENPLAPRSGERWFDRYRINILAENSGCDCAPVIIEDNATYNNLIGRTELRAEFGAMVTDFSQIRAGALHRANGGYLVIEAKSLFTHPMAWEGLKRALRNREVKIEEMAQLYGVMAMATLDPEPIPLDVKVVIIGDERTYQVLYAYDEDFRELFKVRAQFVTRIPRQDQAVKDYAEFVADICRRENLRPFDPGAVARIMDEAARLADDQGKLSTHFAEIADMIREAAFWASKHEREVVTADDVRKVVEERRVQLGYAAEQYVQTIQDGVIFIATEGAVVGQVNGLSVVQAGNFAFGLPSRITAQTFLGRAGVVSIDREVKMSGPIHDKGQLILSSYLASRFAQKRPLSMAASLTFEQLYSGVEGDSASSTELHALLSSLSGVPIKQTVAVTGSVNQFGQVQPIGGANEKIEGFYDVCRARGLTGDQGVMIPRANVRHLMLRDDVVEAVEKGQFHIYAVSTIEEGIELLTGVPAGEADAEGAYPEGSVYAGVQAKLEQYAALLKEAGARNEQEAKKPEPEAPAPKEDPEPAVPQP
jgi:lon-related putative ATP-dependent protease